jgi:DNA-binding transcriptional LysR family regulator
VLKPQTIRQFVIAATRGSFKAAADATFRSQAAVSIAMRELEREIGGELLERDPRGRLTPLAHAVLPLFQEWLALHDAVLAQAHQLATGEQGSLSIAVAPFLAEQWLPNVVAGIAERYPSLHLRTIEERSSHIRGLVADGTVDIGIAGLLDADPRLDVRAIADDRYGVLCNREHPLARRRQVAWNALRSERLIGSDAYEALRAAGIAPRALSPQLVITSRAPLFACVRRNLGVTIVPGMSVPDWRADYAFVPLVRPTLRRTLAIVTRSTESLLPAGRRLVDDLAESLRAFADERRTAHGRRARRARRS